MEVLAAEEMRAVGRITVPLARLGLDAPIRSAHASELMGKNSVHSVSWRGWRCTCMKEVGGMRERLTEGICMSGYIDAIHTYICCVGPQHCAPSARTYTVHAPPQQMGGGHSHHLPPTPDRGRPCRLWRQAFGMHSTWGTAGRLQSQRREPAVHRAHARWQQP